MSLSGFAMLTTIITPIIYPIVVSIITAFFTAIFTEYIRRRISSTRSQKIFLFAMKDYDKEFSKDYDDVQQYINISLIGLSIGGIIAVVLLTIIYSYALNSLFISIVWVIGGIMILRIVVYGITNILSIIKNSRQAYIAKVAGLGISYDLTASLFVSIFAFLFLLFLLQSRHEIFIQDNLEILFTLLISSLILTYSPTALIRWDSDDISSNKTTSWEFMLVNLRIYDIKTSYKLILKLNGGHEVDGKLLQVNNFGIILEVFKPSADNSVKNYVPWQEVVSIEIEKTKI
ncbi:MAG: hypothetical protein RXR51_05605 [Nitrososphaeria archaeon]